MENQPQLWFRRPEAPRVVALCIFFVGLVFRLVGLGWGLPSSENTFSLHPDEPINFAVSQQISVGKGQLDPQFYNYGTLYLTLVSVSSDVIRGYGNYDLSKTEDFVAYSKRVHTAARWISSIAGAATGLFVFLALVRRTGLLASAIGGMVIAIAPGHVVHSRFMTVDVFASGLIAASLFVALRLTEPREVPWTAKQRWQLILGAAALAGLSGGTKYNGILALLPLFIVTFDRESLSKWLKEIAASVGVAVAAFVFATPGVLLNTGKFWQDFQYEVRHASSGHGIVFERVGNGFGLTVFHTLLGLGLLLTLLGVGGLIWGCVKRHRDVIAVSAFSLIFFLLLGTAEIFFLRYTFPLFFGLAFGCGLLVHYASINRRGRHAAVMASALGLAGVPLGGAMAASAWTAHMVNPDIRVVTAKYLRELASKDPSISVGVVQDPWFYTPTFYPLTSAPRSLPLGARLSAMADSSAPKVVQYVGMDPNARFDWDKRLVEELKPNYIVYSSFESFDLERLSRISGNRPEVDLQVSRFKEFQAALRDAYVLELENRDSLEFVHDLAYIRPRISVWKRKQVP